MKRWVWFVIVFDICFVLGGLFWVGGDGERADLVLVTKADLNTLDPQRMSWLTDLRVGECLFERLTMIDPETLVVVPGCAERWEVSDDGLTYTFYLREDARWSNGDAVLASDFKYAWKRGLFPEFGSGYTGLFDCIAGAVEFRAFRGGQLKVLAGLAEGERLHRGEEMLRAADVYYDAHVGVEVVSDKVLRVRLGRVTPYFLELVAFITYGPVHEKSFSDFVSVQADTGGVVLDSGWCGAGVLVSNGAYVLASHRFKRDLLLRCNPYYWGRAEVKNASIRFVIVSDDYTALLMYESGDVDWLPDLESGSALAAGLLDESSAGLRFDVHRRTSAGTYFYLFNCEAKLADGRVNALADVRVRRALSLGIDRESIVEKIVKVHGGAARSFTPGSAIPGYAPPLTGGGYDLVRARGLLREAGYAGGKGIEGLSILYNTEGAHKLIAQQIANHWREGLGVEVRLEGIEKGAFSDRVQHQDFTIARTSWMGDYRDPTTFLDRFRSGDDSNDGRYASGVYDGLLKAAEGELDGKKRFGLLSKAEGVMLGDQAIAPIYHYVVFHVFDGHRVKGVWPNTWQFRDLKGISVDHGVGGSAGGD